MLTVYLISAILICLVIPPIRLLGLVLMLALGYFNPWACVVLLIVLALLYAFFSPTNRS